jgi:fermentation-respiration switch protein FrsA (DUF1100 family)
MARQSTPAPRIGASRQQAQWPNPGKTAKEAPAARVKVWFANSGTKLAAWHYPGTNGACVIMTGGFAVTKEPGTDLFASRFRDAGYSVLAFDYRNFGESGGQPRQVARITEQLDDWQAAPRLRVIAARSRSRAASSVEFLGVRRARLPRGST